MPIRVRIFEERRLVLAIAHGSVTDADMFNYQHEIWARREVSDFDEIVDMTQAEEVPLPTPERMQELADLAASFDQPFASARLAIVASDEIIQALGRIYSAYRQSHPLTSKKVEVFATIEEALRFMGIEELN